jgi:iron-sulfur cluster repair protein YtfE (RIC family)
MADVTKMLEQDHREAEGLFLKIKGSNGAARATLVTKLADALKLHMQVEETIVYPEIAKHVDGGDDLVDEAVSEHQGARKALADVEKLSPDEPAFDGALETLEAGISHHVEEEEEEVFPKFRESVPSRELDALGDQVARAKSAASDAGPITIGAEGADDAPPLRTE